MPRYTVTHARLDGPLVVKGYAHTSKPSLASKRKCLPTDAPIQSCTACGREVVLDDDGSGTKAPGVVEVGRLGGDLGFVVTTTGGKVVNPYTDACLPECKRCNGSSARRDFIEVLTNAYLARVREVGVPVN